MRKMLRRKLEESITANPLEVCVLNLDKVGIGFGFSRHAHRYVHVAAFSFQLVPVE
jgi:hypothetical protein